MSESLKHHQKLLTKTLLDKWNKKEESTYGYNKGKLVFTERNSVTQELKELRVRQISEYANEYSLPPEKEKADDDLYEAYKSLFDWEEELTISTSFNITAEDYLYGETECESEEQAKKYIRGDLEVDQPSAYDYEGSHYIEGEVERELCVEISELTLKQMKEEKYQIIFEVEAKRSEDEEFQSSEDAGFDTIADDLKQLINHKCPYLNVVNSFQEKL